jgi:hypothetical protein
LESAGGRSATTLPLLLSLLDGRLTGGACTAGAATAAVAVAIAHPSGACGSDICLALRVVMGTDGDQCGR